MMKLIQGKNMKRITKLSLVASLALTSSLYAESLSEAFANSKFKGEIKTEYSTSDFLGNSDSDDIWAVGGSLGVVTGDFYGIKAGATFQASSILSEDNNNGVFAGDLDASGAALSEAYLEYTLSNTSLKAGRQYITTPLVSTSLETKSSETLLKDSFEAYVLTNTDIPGTTLVAGYIDKYQAKTDMNGDIGDFEETNLEDGAYTFYAKNTSIENLTLQAQYVKANATDDTQDRDALYFQADYAIAGHTISAQYLSSENDDNDAKLYGLKSTGPLGIGKLGYLVAYNSTTTDNDSYLGEGTGVSDTPFTALPVHGGGVPARGQTDTIVGALVIPTPVATIIPYGGKSFNDEPGLGDVVGLGVMAIAPINKNLLLQVRYEHVDLENTIPPAGINEDDTDTARIYLSYKF